MKQVCSVLILVSKVTAPVTDEASRYEMVCTCVGLCRTAPEAGNFTAAFSKARALWGKKNNHNGC